MGWGVEGARRMGWVWDKVLSKESTRAKYERVLVGLTEELEGVRGAAGRLGAWRRSLRAGVMLWAPLVWVPGAAWAGVFWKGVRGVDRRLAAYLVAVPMVAYLAWQALDAVHGAMAKRLDAKVARLVGKRDACLGELRTRTAGDLSYEDVKALLDRYAGAGGAGREGRAGKEGKAGDAGEGEVVDEGGERGNPGGDRERGEGPREDGGRMMTTATAREVRRGSEEGVRPGEGEGGVGGGFASGGGQGRGAWPGAASEEARAGPLGRAFVRLVNALIGEEPTRCYALVCARCLAHNGLAPADESVQYRCPCCGHLNAHSPVRARERLLRPESTSPSGGGADAARGDDHGDVGRAKAHAE